VRPVDLIPPEERHGERPPLRTGPLAYAIVAVLALALIGVTLMVLTGNKVADHKSEVASLKAQVQAAKAQARRLSPYTSFAAMQKARQDTVTSLATSRFDWERVLREVAIVIPGDVWLTNLTASASAEADASGSFSSSGSTGSSVTAGIAGPSLDIQGCAAGHEAVARFLAALREVDGITRVSVMSSDRPEVNSSTASTSSSTGEGGSVSCSTRNFISTFEVVAAFDGAQPAAPTASSATSPVTPTSSSSDQAPTSADTQSQSQSGDAPTAVVSGTGSTP
jgi:Tfp pilus assembly protein PilN